MPPPKSRARKTVKSRGQQKTSIMSYVGNNGCSASQNPATDKGDFEESSSSDSQFREFVKEKLLSLVQTGEKQLAEMKAFNERLRKVEQKHVEFEEALNHADMEREELRNNGMLMDERTTELSTQVQKLETQLAAQMEETLNLQRYSRSFNLRIGGIKMTDNEHCIDLVSEIFASKFEISDPSSKIENAHRVASRPTNGGSSGDRQPPHVIVKFFRRSDRLEILRKARNVLKDCNLFISQDYCQADYKRKRQLRPVMDNAFKQGKRPRFINGKLYIDGQLYRE